MNKELKGSKERWIKGQELYRSGTVSIGKDGCFYVHNYLVDVEKVWCNCPDYQNRKQPCKHFYAVCAFQKNGKPKNSNDANGKYKEKENLPDVGPIQSTGSNHNSYDRQVTITRLAILNTATEILKIHRNPIELNKLFETARQLEKWALGRGD